MNNFRFFVIAAQILVLVTLLVTPVFAQTQYTIVDLSGPMFLPKKNPKNPRELLKQNPLRLFTPKSMNNKGQIVGSLLVLVGRNYVKRAAVMDITKTPFITKEFGTLGFVNAAGLQQADITGDTESEGWAINDVGQITGKVLWFVMGKYGREGGIRAIRIAPTGKMIDLGVQPGEENSLGVAINSKGQVIGESTGVLSWVAFRTTPDGKINAETAIGGGTPVAINASGEVAVNTGTYPRQKAYLLPANAKFSDDLPDLGIFAPISASVIAETSTLAADLNDNGQITGWSTVKGGYHAFRTAHGGKVTDQGADLGTLGGSESKGHSINSKGDVVGESYPSAGAVQHAFLYTDKMIDLNTLIPPAAASKWLLISAGKINDKGWIMGTGLYGWKITKDGKLEGEERRIVLIPK